MKSITPNADSENKNSDNTRNDYRDYLRERTRQGMIWRSIGNFSLNNIRLWFVTLSALDNNLHWIDKSAILRKNVPVLLRKWRYRVPSLEYVLIVSGGDNGDNPHCHILATADIPDTWQCDDIDSHSVIVGDTSEDKNTIARYCEKNLLQDSEFTSQNFRTSKQFPLWSNPAILHLFWELDSSVTVYIHNSTKTHFIAEEIPMLKTCRYCNEKLPNTHNYFRKNGGGYRGECRHCSVLMDKAIRANRHNAHVGSLDIASWVAYCLERRVKHQYRDDYDNQLVDIENVSIDHMVALALGGDNLNSNVCLTSRKNNSDKSAMSFHAWIRRLYSIGIINQWTSEIDIRNVPRQLKLIA
jgi:hypothetical protein